MNANEERGLAGDERPPEEQTFRHAIGQLLESALDSLPQEYRTVLMLRDIEGLSTLETAECLNLGQRSVQVRLLHARSMLRRRLFHRVVHGAPDTFQFLDARCDRVVENVLNRIRAKAHEPAHPELLL